MPENGAIIHQPPTDMPWGTREMNIADPDGNHFRMGSDSTGPVVETGLRQFNHVVQFGK